MAALISSVSNRLTAFVTMQLTATVIALCHLEHHVPVCPSRSVPSLPSILP